MKKTKCYLFSILILGLYLVVSCKKEDEEANKDFFSKVQPKGWQFEFINNNDYIMNIPGYSDTSLFAVKYTLPDSSFRHLENRVHPQLILFIYPIDDKEVLSYLIQQQQQSSWCIPIYYGEIAPYYIVTSSCFINHGNYSEEASRYIGPLHKAFKDKLKRFNTSIY